MTINAGPVAYVAGCIAMRCGRRVTAEKPRHEEPDDDPLRPARGLVNGLLLSIPLWVIIGALVAAAAQWWWFS